MFSKKNYFIYTLKGWLGALSASLVLSCASLPVQASSITLHSDATQASGAIAKGKKKKKTEIKKKKVKAKKKAKKEIREKEKKEENCKDGKGCKKQGDVSCRRCSR